MSMHPIDWFRQSTFEEKCDWVTRRGIYLAVRRLADCNVLLYDGGRFFVEVYFSTTYNRVLMFNAFTGTRQLMPYVESISLDGLLNHA
jgi:hypothetical protein